MLIWQKYLKVLGQVSSTLPSSTSKYQVLLNFKVSSTSKYQVLDILHQASSTKYKYFTWPQPCMEEICFFHMKLKKLEEISKKFGNDWISHQNYLAWHLTDKPWPEPMMTRICSHDIASLDLKDLRLFWAM